MCGVIRSVNTGGMTTQASADLGGVAAVAADDAEDRRATRAREVDRLDEVDGHALRGVAAAHREDEQSRLGRATGSLQPVGERVVSQPSSLMRAVSSETLSVGA